MRTSRHTHMRTTLMSMSVAVTIVVTLFAASTNVPAEARARFSGSSSVPAVPAAVTEGAKVILGDTSVASPGFVANASEGVGAAISWAGTDPLHHINVMTSGDGLHYGNKLILNQETVDRPAVGREARAGAIAIAWRGTDPQHRVNVLYDPYGVHGPTQHLITSQTTFTTPAIMFFQAHLLLAWAGTDAAHHLNVMPIGIMGPISPGAKTILGFTASTGPSLGDIINGATGAQTAVLSWAMPTTRINLAQSTDGVHFTSALGAGLADLTASSPVFVHFTSEGGPEFWIAWSGTAQDIAHHLNVRSTTAASFPQWTGPKTTLTETALGGPGLGFQEGLLIAWTGTDSDHHLNIARLQ